MQTTETFDSIEMVREIRERHYQATKDMTIQERDEYDRQRYERSKRAIEQVEPLDLSFLCEK